MRVLLLSLLALFLVASSFFAVRLRYFNTEYDAGVIIVTWEAETESEVKTYELYRKASGAGEFSRVAEVDVHGANVPYTVRDDKVYKSAHATVDYRLEVVLSSGLRQQIAERKVNYTPTAIPRSWGSIKAMFQN
ncbi:MAG: hypothetical protein OXE92_01180 [Bacteroidetes bacterium]|nr:hypothetical protein [Bacteroidota bacterium]MCY4204318.1 hypothetical protein [Bacteroidota bacterium]